MKTVLAPLMALMVLAAPMASSALTDVVRVPYADGQFGDNACDLPFRVCVDIPDGAKSGVIRFYDQLATSANGAGSGFWHLEDANGNKVQACNETTNAYGDPVTYCRELGGHFCDRTGLRIPADAERFVVDIDRSRAAAATCAMAGKLTTPATSGELGFLFFD